jgi:DHA1 family multidrug resistance protein-like MFS transporter
MSSTYTLIAPFLPKVSQEKNLPLWLIGLIFALNPIGNVITSLFLGKYLNQLGRKPVLIASYFITGLSLLFLCPIELVDRDLMIVLAIISRLLGGIGVSCLYTCQLTIFISDYPDQMQVMLGRMEAFIGIGMISGPLIGVALYSISLFIALLSIGVVLVVFSVISWKSMGNFRPYEIKKLDMSLTRLSLKLVIFT